MIIIQRSTSKDLEFEVVSGSTLERIVIENYCPAHIKLKLESRSLIEEYKAFCNECFKKGSNFIKEIERAIRKEHDPKFEFRTSGYFYIYFQDNKNFHIYSKVGLWGVNYQFIQV